MPGYVVANYTITNPEGYEPYVPAVVPTIVAAGGEILVADLESESPEGDTGDVTVVLRFESKEAALAWYKSPEYAEAKPLRTENSEGVFMITDGFVPPTA